MDRRIFLEIFFTAFILFLIIPLCARADQTGTLTGTVTDNHGHRLEGALIMIHSIDHLTESLEIRSGSEGAYHIAGVPAGPDYIITAALPGFKTAKREKWSIEAGQTCRLDIQMARGSDRGVDEESGQLAPVIDIKKTHLGETLDSRFIQHIPSDRQFQDLILLLPGVSADPNSGAEGNWNVHGASVRDNAYLIDGMNITDPATGTLTSNFNFDAIEAIEVLTGGYEAEYGQASGAVVNIITKSGGNDLSGQFNVYGVTDVLNSSLRDLETGEPLDEAPVYEAVDPSVNLGGPIKRDTIWFFASYQYVWQNRTFEEAESIPRQMRGQLFSGKGTWQINDANQVALHYQTDPFRSTGLIQDPFVMDEAQPREEQGSHFLHGRWQSALTRNTALNVQAALRRWHLDYTNGDRDLDTNPYTDRVWDPQRGEYVTWSYGNVQWYRLEDRDRIQTNASLTHFKEDWMGTHELKFGGEFEYAVTDKESGIPGDQFFQYQNGENYRMTVSLGRAQSFRQDRVSIYAQDAWSPAPGLTLNLGVRFDRASIDNEIEKLWTWTNVSPRMGMAWDLFNNGKDVVRGHYSRFYAPIIADYAAKLSSEWPYVADYWWDPDIGVWLFP